MREKLTPTINLDGQVYAPREWVWILGFAFAGCDWAVKKASTEEFKNTMRKDLMKTHNEENLNQIGYYESEIERLKKELFIL